MSESDERSYGIARLVLALRQAGVMDQRVLQAMERTPREPFTPKPFLDSAWENVELPIDCGQSMTRPVVVGAMLNALQAEKEHTVLEVGTGSGYAAAVLSRLARRVYSIDRYRTLFERARLALDAAESQRVELRLSDGFDGWPEAAPFDRILVMAAAPEPPDFIARQLVAGGIAVAPVERDGEGLVLKLVKQPDGTLAESVVMRAMFAPLVPGVAREL